MKDDVPLDLSDYGQGQVDVSSSYFNQNLAPVPKASKDWNWFNFTTVWAGMVHNVVQFEIAGLLTFEFGPVIALLITGLAYGTELFAMYLNGHMGAKWGLPFPTSVRPSYGILGSYLPVLLRAFSALFFFSIQTYVGATLINSVLSLIFPAWSSLKLNLVGMPLNMLISFSVFWMINVFALFKGMKEVKYFELVLGPAILLSFILLFAYGTYLAHGLGPLFALSVKPEIAATPYNIGLAAASLAGAYSTLVLNVMDFTRFARTQKDQIIGQALGFPVIFVAFSFLAVGTISTVIYVFHIPFSQAINYVNPVNIMYLFSGNKLFSLLIGITLVAATVGVNVAANLVSPVYDVLSLLPRMSWKGASVTAATVGIFFAPWLWYNSASNIFGALNLLGTALGSVAGVMMVDYWVIRRRIINIEGLFKPRGQYWYRKGVNYRAIAATMTGSVVPVLGYALNLSFLYDFGWYLSLGIGGLSYLIFELLGGFPAAKPNSES
ncbi:MAG: cytosine permease [Thermoprotei archaeon]